MAINEAAVVVEYKMLGGPNREQRGSMTSAVSTVSRSEDGRSLMRSSRSDQVVRWADKWDTVVVQQHRTIILCCDQGTTREG